jgi:bifunctional non-homologous end joining protein LigD
MPYQRTKPSLGVKAPFPGFIRPALATSVAKVPNDDRWIHEIKFDGYRVQLHIANDTIRVFTRRGNDWTKRFRKVANDAYLLNAKSAIIDGEVIVPQANGTSDFSVLQNELRGKSERIVMVAFDLLYFNGNDLRKVPLIDRKAALQRLIAKTAIQFSDNFETDGATIFKHACKVGLEGVVSKRRDSKYQSDRQRLGEGHMPSTRDITNRRLRDERKSFRRNFRGTPKRRRPRLRWQGGPRIHAGR